MTRYEMVQTLSIDDLAWFIFTIIETTENQMLEKLATYGLDVNILSLDPQLRQKGIVNDLLKEVDNATNC